VALIRRGEVWVARLNPNQGAEVGKVRPVVVPLTSQRRRGAEALRVSIRPRDRLLRECWAMAEQPAGPRPQPPRRRPPDPSLRP